jgi:hypothetical protein
MVSITEANRQLDEIQVKQEAIRSVRYEILRVESSIMRISAELGRMTGSKEVSQAIREINRLITVFRMLDVTLRLFETGGPHGWALAGLSIVATTLTVGSTLYDGSRGY